MFKWHDISGNVVGVNTGWYGYHNSLSGYSLSTHEDIVTLSHYYKFPRYMDTNTAALLYRYEYTCNMSYWKWVSHV